MTDREIITQAEAKARGIKRYFTGRPCKRGHLVERSTGDRHCVSCIRNSREGKQETLRLRLREWHKKNPGKRAAYGRAAYKKNRTKILARQQEWMERNREVQREQNRRRKEKNPEKYKAIQRKYQLNGPQNPTGERQWLRKNLAQLRTLKRLLRNPNLAASQSRNAESAPAHNSLS